jgi:hypothetical protein
MTMPTVNVQVMFVRTHTSYRLLDQPFVRVSFSVNRRKNATFDTPNMSDAGDVPRACEYVLLIVRMALSTWAGQCRRHDDVDELVMPARL